MGERQFGPYRLVRQIAVGGMAEIHLAKTKGIAGFEKYVALKMIHPNFAEDEQFIQMLVDEAKIAVQLTHGNIAQTFDLGRVGETYYITMEYVDGADLYKVLRRSSERDIELPLDVCAFIAKEITSALDHAHRKRDHVGKPLGIVHRDVSPQNVLLSYAGEVKLVDFGIAKATMKARQTAVGVIKGKYYYMSPEQAWGDPIDHRSDIFSAGIVLYEMITGQMLYLEEDLHKLLDMARRADIAPPSRLRKGVPPQLERIVMHALSKVPGERYQSAGDFATDLERFLHTYSPVFTASKIAGLLRNVVGDPNVAREESIDIEIRGGPESTNQLDQSQVVQARDEIRDENSVIFRVAELQPPPKQPAPVKPKQPTGNVPRVTRATDSPPVVRPVPALPPKPIAPGKPLAPPVKQTGGSPAVKPPTRPRKAHEDTRQLDAPPLPPDNGSLDDIASVLPMRAPPGSSWDQGATHDTNPGTTDDLETAGEHTMITAPSASFMLDMGTDPGDDDEIRGEPTMISAMPQHDEPNVPRGRPDDVTLAGEDDDDEPTHGDDDEGPTLSRDFTAPQPAKNRAPSGKRPPAPPALAAKIHAPAVSELRKPRASRRTPGTGIPTPPPNVLQAIVNTGASEPMPAPRPNTPPQQPVVQPTPYQSGQMPVQHPGQSGPMQPMHPGQSGPLHQQPMQPGQFGPMYPANQYSPQALADTPHASQLQNVPGVPPHLQPYLHMQGYPPQQPPYGYQPGQSGQQPAMGPGSMYPFTPYGQQRQPLSLTGQLRLAEVDEVPAHLKLGPNKSWMKWALGGGAATVVIVGIALLATSLGGDEVRTVGSVRIESVPVGAEIVFDGERLAQKTPFTVENVAISKAHEVRIELPKHKPYLETLTLAPTGAEYRVLALLKVTTGTLVVKSTPSGAEVRIGDQIRGRTPTTVTEIDMASAGRIELRLKDHEPFSQELKWPESGTIEIDAKLRK